MHDWVWPMCLSEQLQANCTDADFCSNSIKLCGLLSMLACGNTSSSLRISLNFWVSKCEAVFVVATFHISSVNFFKTWTVFYSNFRKLSISRCKLTCLLLNAWNSFARVSDFPLFTANVDLVVWPLILLKLWLICRKCSTMDIKNLWKEKHSI